MIATADALAELVAARQCEQLVFEFVRRIDAGERTAIAELFTGTGSWQAGREPIVGTEALAAFFARPSSPAVLTRHLVTNVSITPDGPDRARGHALVLWFRFERPGPALHPDVVEDSGPYHVQLGEYHDVFARTPDGWRFQTRARRYLRLSSSGALPAQPVAAGTPARPPSDVTAPDVTAAPAVTQHPFGAP